MRRSHYHFGGKSGARSMLRSQFYAPKRYSKTYIRRVTGVTGREYEKLKKDIARERVVDKIWMLARWLTYGLGTIVIILVVLFFTSQ